MTTLSKKIEGVLFYRAEPLSYKELAKLLKTDEKEIKEGIQTLAQELSERGIVVMQTDDAVSLATHPELSEMIKKIAEEERERPLTKAALETLSIVVYHNPVSKPHIDYIRGVNSHFILRNLLVRGLVEKIPNPKDARTFLYKPTFDLLSYLGIQSSEDMPEFSDFRQKFLATEGNKEANHEEV